MSTGRPDAKVGNTAASVFDPGTVLAAIGCARSVVLADKAYSTHDFRAVLVAMDCDPVIPSSSSWINPPSHDKDLYKARAEVECTFSLLKQARRFATPLREDPSHYAAVVAIGYALLWLRI